jgi:aminotransferase
MTGRRNRISTKAMQFTESVIREMTRQAILHDAVNLSQGFPDFAAPEQIKLAARDAIAADINQYAITWGAKPFRDAIARNMMRWGGMEVDPETEITVCCGSTEAMISAMLAIVDPGDEVVVFEPFYENYGPDAILSGAVARFVPLHPPADPGGEWTLDEDELRAAFNARTRAIIINTPNNPTGKVFTRRELGVIRDLCVEFDVIAITDEIYEHILYDDARHHTLATFDGMSDRTITVNALSKTFSVTGWRVGWTIAPADITGAIRKVHDFLTVGAAAPLQAAGVVALDLPDDYYRGLAADYLARRNCLLNPLREAGFHCFVPRGAYYIMTGIGSFGFENDLAFTEHLVREIGVAVVPGSSFFHDRRDGAQQVRFAFCKTLPTLEEAGRRLRHLQPRRKH